MDMFYVWFGLTMFLLIMLILSGIFIIIISRKTHGLIEFKSGVKGTPIGLFFQDNKYCDWKNTKPDAGMVEDKVYGTFVIDSTYIDKKTKNILIPFNASFAMSLNVKAAKLADDLTYIFKEQQYRKMLKKHILAGTIKENETVKTLRTSINFSTLKHFVSPVLPHNIKSKIINTVYMRIKQKGLSNVQNIIIIAISALGAFILGGMVLRYIMG